MKLANVVSRCFKRADHTNGGWATEKDIRPLLKSPDSGGVVIGGYEGQPLIYDGNNHVVAIGSNRSGKSAGLVIPTLMQYHGSVVVHDVGGDLYKSTAEHRRAMGQKVIRFAPEESGSNRFNPLDTVRFGTTHEAKDLLAVAMAICPPTDYFAKVSLAFVFDLLLYVTIQSKDIDHPTFTLADICALSQCPDILGRLQHSENAQVRADAETILRRSDNELSGILSTVRFFLEPFSDDAIIASTSASDFDLAELRNGDMPVTLYLVSQSRLDKRSIRLHQAILALLINNATSREQDHRHPLLLLLDDYAMFERGIPALLDRMDTLQAYGIQSYVLVQDAKSSLSYENAAIMENSPIRIFLGWDSIESLEYVAKRIGMGIDNIPQSTGTCITSRAGNAPILGSLLPFGNG